MDENTRLILEAARQAPSADNTQPWRVIVSGPNIDLYHAPERDISPYDSSQSGSLVAHGAFIENASLAATSIGRFLEVDLDVPSAANNWHVAQMRLGAGRGEDAIENELYMEIAKRTTNRKPYMPEKLSHGVKEELVRYTKSTWGSIKVLDYPQTSLARAVSVPERISFQNAHVHKNLFKNIRWNEGEVAQTRDGFSIATFELPVAAYVIFRIARNWRRLRILNILLGLAKSIPTQTSALYEQSGAYIGLTGPAQSAQDYVKLGRLMQRAWLSASRLGVSMQPVTAVLFFHAAIVNKTTDVFSQEEQDLIRESFACINDAFRPVSGERVLFVFRAGVAENPSARTTRLALADILRSHI